MKQRKIIQVKEDKAVEWGESSEDKAHQERVKVLSESGFGKQRQFYFFQNNFLSSFLAAWGLHCCMGFSLAAVHGGFFGCGAWGFSLAAAHGGFSLAAAHGGFSLAVVCGLLIAVASPVVEHRLQGVWASVVTAPGP